MRCFPSDTSAAAVVPVMILVAKALLLVAIDSNEESLVVSVSVPLIVVTLLVVAFKGFLALGNDAPCELGTVDHGIGKIKTCACANWTTQSGKLEYHSYHIWLYGRHWRWSSLWSGWIEVVPLILTSNCSCTDFKMVVNFVLRLCMCYNCA